MKHPSNANDSSEKSTGVPQRVEELIEAGFGAMVYVHDPEAGGSADALRETHEARAWLLCRLVESGIDTQRHKQE